MCLRVCMCVRACVRACLLSVPSVDHARQTALWLTVGMSRLAGYALSYIYTACISSPFGSMSRLRDTLEGTT